MNMLARSGLGDSIQSGIAAAAEALQHYDQLHREMDQAARARAGAGLGEQEQAACAEANSYSDLVGRYKHLWPASDASSAAPTAGQTDARSLGNRLDMGVVDPVDVSAIYGSDGVPALTLRLVTALAQATPSLSAALRGSAAGGGGRGPRGLAEDLCSLLRKMLEALPAATLRLDPAPSSLGRTAVQALTQMVMADGGPGTAGWWPGCGGGLALRLVTHTALIDTLNRALSMSQYQPRPADDPSLSGQAAHSAAATAATYNEALCQLRISMLSLCHVLAPPALHTWSAWSGQGGGAARRPAWAAAQEARRGPPPLVILDAQLVGDHVLHLLGLLSLDLMGTSCRPPVQPGLKRTLDPWAGGRLWVWDRDGATASVSAAASGQAGDLAAAWLDLTPRMADWLLDEVPCSLSFAHSVLHTCTLALSFVHIHTHSLGITFLRTNRHIHHPALPPSLHHPFAPSSRPVPTDSPSLLTHSSRPPLVTLSSRPSLPPSLTHSLTPSLLAPAPGAQPLEDGGGNQHLVDSPHRINERHFQCRLFPPNPLYALPALQTLPAESVREFQCWSKDVTGRVPQVVSMYSLLRRYSEAGDAAAAGVLNRLRATAPRGLAFLEHHTMTALVRVQSVPTAGDGSGGAAADQGWWWCTYFRPSPLLLALAHTPGFLGIIEDCCRPAAIAAASSAADAPGASLHDTPSIGKRQWPPSAWPTKVGTGTVAGAADRVAAALGWGGEEWLSPDFVLSDTLRYCLDRVWTLSPSCPLVFTLMGARSARHTTWCTHTVLCVHTTW